MDDIIGKKTGRHGGGAKPLETACGSRIAPGSTGGRQAAMAAAAFMASTMAITGASATALAATAGETASTGSGAVASVRSFPSARQVHRSLAEAVSATEPSRSMDRGEADGTWSLDEDLDVPVTRSTDEKQGASALQAAVDMGGKKYADSEGQVADDSVRAALKQAVDAAAPKLASTSTSADDLNAAAAAISDAAGKVDESMRAKQEADQRAAAAASSRRQSQAGVGSDAGYGFTYTVPTGKSSSDVVDFAMQFVGKVPYVWGGTTTSGWDCSGFVMYVYSHFGVSLPHYSGSQAHMGRAISSLAEAKPGDVIANDAHAAIYIGNGMVVNALNPEAGTATTPVNWAFTGGYSIRRIIG